MHSWNVVGALGLLIADLVRDASEEATELSGAAPAALVAVVAEPGMSIERLRHALHLTHPGAVRLIDRLESKGWVAREPGPRRAVALHATPEGRRAAGDVVAAREQALTGLLSSLESEEARFLEAIAGRVLARSTGDVAELRRRCRLCDRSACQPCPPWEAVRATHGSDGREGDA